MKKALLILLMLGSSVAFATDGVVNLTCDENGRESGLKELVLITQPSGKMHARVTVANGTSPAETYSYMVRRLPPTPHRSGRRVNYRAALGKLQLSICTTCAPTGSKHVAYSALLNFTAPSKAKYYAPGSRLVFKDVACNLLK